MKEKPVIAFLYEVDNEQEVKKDLLKLKFPKDIIGLITGESLGQARLRAKDARTIANMAQMRTLAELIYEEDKNYRNLSCQYSGYYSQEIKSICGNIETQAGSKPTIWATSRQYCAYTKLHDPGKYYCIDNGGSAVSTYINPGEGGYCTGWTFVCPTEPGIPPPIEPPQFEKIGFKKEIVNEFEIHSLPIFGEYGFNFATKEKKIVFTFTKDGLVNILTSLDDFNQKKLKDSEFFAEQFKKAPKNVTEISYSYPYGFLGGVKWLTNSYIDIVTLMMSSIFAGASDFSSELEEFEKLKEVISEFLDRGIAPYLKVLKSVGSYSYSPEKGLMVNKGRLIIEELPTGEKKATEEFWENIEEWFEEKSGPVYAPSITPIY